MSKLTDGASGVSGNIEAFVEKAVKQQEAKAKKPSNPDTNTKNSKTTSA